MIVESTANINPLVGDSDRVSPTSKRRTSEVDDESIQRSRGQTKKSRHPSIKVGSNHPNVQALSANSARVIIVGQICYTLVHTTIYAIGLRFWNVVTPYFILIWFLEEIPNAYAFTIAVCSQIDPYIPSNVQSTTTQLQKILYIWKPIAWALAYFVLFLDVVPFCFGCYLWFYGDGPKDQEIGQTTMIEALANTLPYIYSLVLMYVTLEYIHTDLHM